MSDAGLGPSVPAWQVGQLTPMSEKIEDVEGRAARIRFHFRAWVVG